MGAKDKERARERGYSTQNVHRTQLGSPRISASTHQCTPGTSGSCQVAPSLCVMYGACCAFPTTAVHDGFTYRFYIYIGINLWEEKISFPFPFPFIPLAP